MHRLSYDWRTRVAHGSLPKRLPEFLRFMKKLDLHTYFRGALHPTGPKFWSFGISDQPIPRRSTFCSDKFYMCIRDEKCKAFTVHAAVALGQRARLHFCKDHKVTSQEKEQREGRWSEGHTSLSLPKRPRLISFWDLRLLQNQWSKKWHPSSWMHRIWSKLGNWFRNHFRHEADFGFLMKEFILVSRYSVLARALTV